MIPRLIGPLSRWSQIGTHAPPIPLVPPLIAPLSPTLIGPPPQLIGPPSHWSPNATLVIQFSLVPHIIGPPV